MRPYGQKRDWAEGEMTNKSRNRKATKGQSKKRTRFWKKRARQLSKKGLK